MDSSPVLVCGRRPVPLPAECILVAPLGLHTIDGSPSRAKLVVRRHDASVVATVPPEPAALRSAISDALRASSTAIWFAGRRRLRRLHGREPIALERSLAAIASTHDVRFVGFTGDSAGPPARPDAYAAVREPSSLTTRRPNRHE